MVTLDHARSGRVSNHIRPFLWMRGEENERIGEELNSIQSCGISEVCLESRPHPDFAGPLWWKNLDFILKEARRRGMRVWVLDDDKFPTGHCNSALEKKHPELAKVYLRERHMDMAGPCRSHCVLIRSFLPEDAELLGILAFPKPDGESMGVADSGILDLTDRVQDGMIYFDLPEGFYRLFVVYTTRTGGGRPGYMNLIDSASVRVLLDEIYEKHYEHYKEYFGKEFAGFFTDEPELGNVPGYPFDCALGQACIPLPWSRELETLLLELWGENFRENLPALWYERGVRTPEIRTDYMDALTRLVQKCFSGQIGAWCREHQVEYIGHVLEDSNSHNKLGCGIGHYFREMQGQHMAGVDVVHHEILPGFTEKYHTWVAGETDGEFFHFGLAKLGSSAAHLDPKKKNRALCEIFGNYGWAEGIGLMKWLTDHMLVRGINEFTPHAFSMQFPDPDCPPHFYARGENPQFPAFRELMRYMNRMADILGAGTHLAQAAVIYHGETEWADPDAMLFQKPVRKLLERQLDCDVVPFDLLDEKTAKIRDGRLQIGENEYACLLLPGCDRIPQKGAEFLMSASGQGLPVYAVERRPTRYFDGTFLPEEFEKAVGLVSLKETGGLVCQIQGAPVTLSEPDPGLRMMVQRQEDGLAGMLFNENISRKVQTRILDVQGKSTGRVYLYDAWQNQLWEGELSPEGLPVTLLPGESILIFVPFSESGFTDADTILMPFPAGETAIDNGWRISRKPWKTTEFEEYVGLKPGEPLPNLNGPGYDPRFVGTYRYQCEFYAQKEQGIRYSLKIPEAYDGAEIRLNRKEAGRLIQFPSRIWITELLQDEKNSLEIEITTTLFWNRRDGISSYMQVPASGMTALPVLETWR